MVRAAEIVESPDCGPFKTALAVGVFLAEAPQDGSIEALNCASASTRRSWLAEPVVDHWPCVDGIDQVEATLAPGRDGFECS